MISLVGGIVDYGQSNRFSFEKEALAGLFVS